MARALRLTTLFVIVVNSLFVILDFSSHPEEFGALLGVRLAWNIAMLTVYALANCLDTLRMLQAGVMVSGIALIALIAAAGGLTSDYWPGIMILFVGIPVFLPVSGTQAAVMSGVLLALFAAIPLVSGGSLTSVQHIAPVFFASAAALECIASSALLDRLRLAEFMQKREIEQARDHLSQMDQVKARFTANVHHELRTPLTLTLSPLESLLAGDFGDLTPLQRSYLKTMHVNALRLLKLINNLLDLAKLENDELRLSRRLTNIGKLVEELIQGAMPLAEKKSVALTMTLHSNVPEVYADTDAVERIVLNLLSNALKFTDANGKIHVTVEEGPDGGVVCAVKDTGMGLDATELERVFDRFAQVDTSATRKHEGTGIGLSLVRELVSLHGGRVWATSAGLGEGVTMTFWLPAGESDGAVDLAFEDVEEVSARGTGRGDSPRIRTEIEQRSTSRYFEIERHVGRLNVGFQPMENEQSSRTTKNPRIVVCEDNIDMRTFLRDLLSPEFSVWLAANGREGLELVQKRHPDLVLTDVMMPEMSGIELCRVLKGDPLTAPIPVVLVTSKAERDMKIEGLEEGADDYVTKPFHSKELLARVRSLVKLRLLGRELAQQNDRLARANDELADAMGELKETESQIVRAERLAAVGELAAGLAHEVNNPVNFARNAAKTMSTYVSDVRNAAEAVRTATSDQCRTGERTSEAMAIGPKLLQLDEAASVIDELSEIIAEGLDRTARLVGDLHEFAAPWNGERSQVDLRRTVDSALQLTHYQFQSSQVRVQVQQESDLPLVIGDSRAIGQVVLNILKNAAEALEDRQGGRVKVVLSSVDNGVAVRISDDGPGVSAEAAARVFDPFFTTKPAGRGTGLGLSISRQIIEDHGGHLSLASTPGSGADFTIWLPRESDDAN